MGQYTLRPPTVEELKKNSMAGMDAVQYYESSGTGTATPFRFLAELKMTQNGQQLFDAYYTALKTVCHTILHESEEYIKKNKLNLQKELTDNQIIKNSLSIRIRAFLRRDDTSKIDTEVLFYIDESEKGEKDFAQVCRKAGIVPVVKLAECLASPLEQADQSIRANM